jgi:hypothetical protein
MRPIALIAMVGVIAVALSGAAVAHGGGGGGGSMAVVVSMAAVDSMPPGFMAEACRCTHAASADAISR